MTERFRSEWQVGYDAGVAAERARLREAVEGLPGTGRRGMGYGTAPEAMVWSDADRISRDRVLALLADEGAEETG